MGQSIATPTGNANAIGRGRATDDRGGGARATDCRGDRSRSRDGASATDCDDDRSRSRDRSRDGASATDYRAFRIDGTSATDDRGDRITIVCGATETRVLGIVATQPAAISVRSGI